MIIVKLGGSILTKKDDPLVARIDVIERLGEELKPAYPHLILTHGTGSFGHPIVLKYKIHRGFHGRQEERIGISETKYWVNHLTQMVIRSLIDAGVPAFPFYASSLGVMDNGRFVSFNSEPIRGYLNMGIVPVLPADGPYDRSFGALIASGDYLVEVLTREFKPSYVVFAVDVDGLYFNGQLVERLNLEELEGIYKGLEEGKDATGGLKGKLRHVLEILKMGVPVKLVNGLVEGRIKSLLMGNNPPHTHIKP